jgi:O-antigen/teichoic acid export membrane protein
MIDFVFRSYTSVISQLTGIILQGDQARPLRDRLVKATTGSFGLRVAGAGFSFIINLLLARLLGVAGYGAYSYAIAWIGLLAVPALFGLERLLIREIAVYRVQAAWDLMRGLLLWADRTVLKVSLGLGLAASGLIWILADRLGYQMATVLWLGFLMLPFVTLVRLRQASLHGLNQVVLSLFPEYLIRPLLLTVLLGSAYFFLRDDLKPQWALGLHTTTVVVSLLIGTYLLHKMLPELARDVSPNYQIGAWTRSALPMVLISGMNEINNRIDTIMLGVMKEAEAVGIYNVANRGAQFILLIQTAVDLALAPTIAGLHAAGKMARLQNVITKSTQVVLLLSLSVGIGLVAFGERFLLLFGSMFVQGHTALAILAAGCVVSNAAGLAAVMLVMTGHERDAALSIGTSVVLNVILNMALIPLWSVEGAATATSISMMARNILMVLLVYRRVGIHFMPLRRNSLKTVQ